MDNIFKDFSFSSLSFQNDFYFWLFCIAIGFLFFEYFPGRRFNFSIKKLKKFIDENLISHLLQGSDNKSKTIFRIFYSFVICSLLIFAIANPRWSFTEIEAYKANANILFAVDLSKSMDARDEKPSRLERAKQEIKDILEEAPNLNFGVFGFANQAHIITPLTQDKKVVNFFLNELGTELVSIQGSNVDAAVKMANLIFNSRKGQLNYLVLMSDGDFDTSKNMANYKIALKDAKLVTYGFGSKEGAPVRNADGSFLKQAGKIIISKFSSSNLRNLSHPGHYIKSSYLDDDVNKFLEIIEKNIEKETDKYQTIKIWDDKFYIPLILAMLLMAPLFMRNSVFPVIIAALLTSSILFSSTSTIAKDKNDRDQAGSEVNLEFLKWDNIKENIKGLNLFRNDAQKAILYFENRDYENAIDGFKEEYNKAVAAYRMKDFAVSEKNFEKSYAKRKDIKSQYNLANAQLMQLKLEEAIKNYEEVLKKDKEYFEAIHNLKLAKRLLKNQNKQQKNKSDQNDKEQDDGESSDDGNQEKSDGNSDKEGDKENNSQSNSQQEKQDKAKSSGTETLDMEINEDEQEARKKALKELNNTADKIFDRVENNKSEFMKNRFKMEEMESKKQGKIKSPVRPW